MVDVSCGICQRGAVHDLASVSQEHAEQGCLAGGEVHQVAVDLRAAPRHVERDAGGLDHLLGVFAWRRGRRRRMADQVSIIASWSQRLRALGDPDAHAADEG
ncbi:MAG TPA: hypothetical protein VIY28_18230 [Pseudonocardiaceae bacterium]